jgi:hypothetical protein
VRRIREPATTPTEPFDAQQTLMLEVLGRAEGEPVSYEALRDAGVEYPASVASELELVGVQLERPFNAAGPRREPLGVRLSPQREHDHELHRPRYPPSPAPESDAPAREDGVLAVAAGIIDGEARALAGDVRRLAGAAGSAARGAVERVEPALRLLANEPRRRLIAPAALLAALVIVAVLTIVDLAGSSPARRPAPLRLSSTNASASRASQAAHKAAASAKAPATSGGATAAPPGGSPAASGASAHPPPPGASPAAAPAPSSPPTPVPAPTQVAAAQLEAEGHALLASGEAARAIPVLRNAISATGQSLGQCLAPSSEACLTYAYALYDLGAALRLAGQSSEAVPILEQRLQIANQRGTVRHELRLARGTGSGGSGGPHGGGEGD